MAPTLPMARGLLMLMLMPTMASPMLLHMPLLEFPSDPPLGLMPSPRAWMPPLKDMPLMPTMDMDSDTMVRFEES